MLFSLIILSLLPIHIWTEVTAATERTNTTTAAPRPKELGVEPTSTSFKTTLQQTTIRTESTSRPTCGSSTSVCRRGYDGPQGPQGLPGVQGIQGPRGTPGIEGCRGAPGRVGSQGIPGIPGLDGTRGVPGPVGLKGERGEPGTCNCKIKTEASPKENAASYVNAAPAQLIAQRRTGRNSAFSVARVTPILPDPVRNNTAITFDVIYSNLGNDFDIKTGTYTCPLNGTYYFNAHVYKHKIVKKPSVRLYKNEEYIMVIDDFAPPNTHDSTSTTVLLSLVTGDRVWLDLNRKIKMHHNLWRRTIFSGFLLFPADII